MIKIGELSRLSGLSTTRIRFYETKGLLPSVGRGTNGYRYYPDEAVFVLKTIAIAQRAGFSLAEMRPLLPPPRSGVWDRERLLHTLEAKIAEINALQQHLRGTVRQLRIVVDSVRTKPAEKDCVDNIEPTLALLEAALAGAR